jgi:exodeoxyribonuclease VII small subunit
MPRRHSCSHTSKGRGTNRRITTQKSGWRARWTMAGVCRSVRAMSKPAKAAEAARIEQLPFEAALQRLEAIVETMESEELPLESLLSKYEEGTKLARVCQSRLADAELKLQQLEQNAQGALVLKPVTPGDEELKS